MIFNPFVTKKNLKNMFLKEENLGYILVPKQILIFACSERNVNYNTVCTILSGIAPLPPTLRSDNGGEYV
jgi:hypothetical protein